MDQTNLHITGKVFGLLVSLLLLLLPVHEVHATVYTSVSTGSWGSSSTWDLGAVPTSTDSVIITGGFTVTLSSNTTINQVTIANSSTLSTGHRSLVLNGNLIDNGTLTANSSITFTGGAGISLDGTGQINLNNNNFQVNGNVNILSSASLSVINTKNFQVSNNDTIFNYGSISIDNNIKGGASSSWINEMNSYLGAASNVQITLNASATGNTVDYNGTANQNVILPSSTYYNLTASGSGIKTLTGNTAMAGSVNISSILSTNNNNLNVGGDWTDAGSLTAGTGTVTFDGSGSQTISNSIGESFYNLTVNNSGSGLTLSGNVNVSNILTMTAGNITTGSNTLTLGTGTSVPGTLTYTSGTVVGNFERWINTTGTAFLFPVGTTTYYRPANINFTSLTGGSLIATFVSTDPGKTGLPLGDGVDTVRNTFSDGYWTLTAANSLASTAYNLSLTGNGFAAFTINGSTRIVYRTSSSASWAMNGTHVTASGNTANRNGMSGFGDYAFGDTTQCQGPVTSAITGLDSVCTNASGQVYSVTNNAGDTYTWTVTGGTIASGQGTNSITVNWGATGMVGNVDVVEANTCTQGAPVDLPVNIHTLPTSAISGNAAVAENSTGEIYSVTANLGYTYTWTVTGGTIVSGQGTNSITVNWGVSGTGNVQVDASCGCGSATTVSLPVDIYVVIKSVANGLWTAAATWDCGCVPATTDNVIVTNGNTVTLSSNTTINNLTIDAGATLSDNGKSMTIDGSFTDNGAYSGSQNLTMTGGSSIELSGSGNITTSRAFNINGNITIPSGASLTIAASNGVAIGNNVIVTNNGSVNMTGPLSGNNTTTWINAANSYLNLGSTIQPTLYASGSGNTVEYSGTSAQTIILPNNSTYYNLTVSGSGTLAGNTIIDGNLTISNTLNTGNFNLSIAGNWTNTGSFTAGTGTVTFDGSSNQTVSSSIGETYYNLTINNSGGSVTFDHATTVSNVLNMTSGNIDMGSNTMTLGTSTTVTGSLSYTAGTILGSFERWVNTSGTAILFPIGTSSAYLPASVNFTSLTGGSLIAQFVASDPGTNGLPLGDSPDTVRNTFSEGYWKLTAANSLTSTNYNLSLTGNGFTSFTINGSTRIIYRTASTNPWAINGTHVAASGNTANRNAMNGFGQYAFGDTTNCTGPVTSVITGADSVCTNDNGEGYSVINNAGDTYTWTVTGGTIATGQGTNSITVNWGATGMVGSVQVVEANSCTQGAPVSLAVNIHSLPTASITGKSAVAANTTAEPYKVTGRLGYTYTWTVTGGTIASGQGTDSITVNWGAAGTGNVQVVASSACGSAPAVSLSVDVYVVIKSIATGNWNSTTTWDCGCVPASTDNVEVDGTYTVTLNNNTTINNIVIKSTGTLFDNNKNMTVNGDFTCNGSYTGSGNLTLAGGNATIDGTGNITTSGSTIITAGKTIASTASLVVSPGNIQMQNNIVVTNNGSIIVGGNLTSSLSSATWINAGNSGLTVGGTLLSTGQLSATATGNTVTYNGPVGQTVKPVQYFNLGASGSGVTSLSSTLHASGNVNVSGTLTTNNFNIYVAGNWTDNGTFNPGTDTIFFNGTSSQTITKSAGETFNELEIDGSGTTTLGGAITVTKDFYISPGAAFDVSASNYSVNLQGNFYNNGTFNAEKGTATFNGTAAQQIGGTSITTFNNITLNNTSGASIANNENLHGILTISSGTFTTTGYVFTLLSDANGTASIGTIPSGSNFTGNITMQRYLAPGNTDWRMLGSPVTNTTLSDWNNEFIMSGIPGCQYPNYPASVFTYDETVAGNLNNGFVAPSSTSVPLVSGAGYFCYVGPVPLTFDVAGTPATFTQNLPVSYTVTSGGAGNDGWNLVANPYPSSINWDAVSGWTKTNINNAIYIYNPSLQQYASYVGGLGTNGGTNIIPSSQAFWVVANAASPVLSLNESVKSSTDQSFMKTTSYSPGNGYSILLKVNGNGGYSDDTYVAFNNAATNQFDGQFDAKKLYSGSNNVPSICSTMYDTMDYSINSLPLPVSAVSVPVKVKVPVTGTYTITDSLLNYPSGTCLMLKDLLTGNVVDLRTTPSYSFTISDTTTLPRFILEVGAPMQTQTAGTKCYGGSDGMAVAADLDTASSSIYQWYKNGTLLRIDTTHTGADTLKNQPAGTYAVTVIDSASSCSTVSDTLVISQPAMLTVSAAGFDVSCYGDSDGQAVVIPSGGTPSYQYLWTPGNGTNSSVNNLTAGTYTVTVTDGNGCISDSSLVIQQPSQLQLAVISDSAFCNQTGGASVSVNGGNPGYTYLWSPGGQTTATVSGLVPGQYNVQVSDMSGCSDTASTVVGNGQFVQSAFVTNADTAYLATGGTINFTSTSQGASSYLWSFGDGSTNTSPNPVHSYYQAGTDTVSLIVSNGNCTDSSSKIITVVGTTTGMNVNTNVQYVQTSYQNSNIEVNYNLQGNSGGEIEIYDALGQQVYKGSLDAGSKTLKIPFNEHASGVYLVRILFNGKMIVRKVAF